METDGRNTSTDCCGNHTGARSHLICGADSDFVVTSCTTKPLQLVPQRFPKTNFGQPSVTKHQATSLNILTNPAPILQGKPLIGLKGYYKVICERDFQ